MEVEFKKKGPAKPFPDRFELVQNKYYIMKSDQEITKNASTKKLITYLSNHATELSKFAKEENISVEIQRNYGDFWSIIRNWNKKLRYFSTSILCVEINSINPKVPKNKFQQQFSFSIEIL